MNAQVAGRLLQRLHPNGTQSDYVELREVTVAGVPLTAVRQVRQEGPGRTIYLPEANEAELLDVLRARRPAANRTVMGEAPTLLAELSPNTPATRVQVYETAVGTATMLELRLVPLDTASSNGRSIYLTGTNQVQFRARLEKGRPDVPEYGRNPVDAVAGEFLRCRACGQPTVLRVGRVLSQTVCSVSCGEQKRIRPNELLDSVVFMHASLGVKAADVAHEYGLSWTEVEAIMRGF